MIAVLAKSMSAIVDHTLEGIIGVADLYRVAAFFMRLGDILLVLTIIDKCLEINRKIRGK